ncbi:MAG: hypothetical protein AAFV43_11840 [Planctomycetota bacterium]
MTKRNVCRPILWSWVVAAALPVAAVGCGDNRPKIRKPDKPAPVPDASMRLSNDPDHAPAPQPGS